MKYHFEKNLLDRVTTIHGIVGIITTCAIDGGGEVYNVEWKKEDGSIGQSWHRLSEFML